MVVDYTPPTNEVLLKISPVEVEDEANYKCEITYLEVRENCDVVQIIKLVTLGKFYINFCTLDSIVDSSFIII